MLESLIAISVLAIASILVAQVGATALTERARLLYRLTMLETANNILATAQTMSVDDLTREWAESQKLTEEWLDRHPDTQLVVSVAPTPDFPRGRRVTVRIDRSGSTGEPVREVELVADFVERRVNGGKP